MGFKVAGQIVLRAAGLREDHGLARSAHGAHALKALLQRRQQRVGLLVFADVSSQAQVFVQLGQLFAHDAYACLLAPTVLMARAKRYASS